MKKMVCVVLVVAACAHVPIVSQRSVCPHDSPDSVRPFTSADAAALVGSYDLVQVNTAWNSIPVYRTRLTLALPDSADRQRASVRSFGHSPRLALQLLGLWSADRPNMPVEVDDGVLYLGCRDCNDASPDLLRIRALSSTGFSGTWYNVQTGIGYDVDSKGHRLPAASGYFCALRRP